MSRVETTHAVASDADTLEIAGLQPGCYHHLEIQDGEAVGVYALKKQEIVVQTDPGPPAVPGTVKQGEKTCDAS